MELLLSLGESFLVHINSEVTKRATHITKNKKRFCVPHTVTAVKKEEWIGEQNEGEQARELTILPSWLLCTLTTFLVSRIEIARFVRTPT